MKKIGQKSWEIFWIFFFFDWYKYDKAISWYNKTFKFWKELTSVKTSQTVIHLPQRKVKNDQRRLDLEKY